MSEAEEPRSSISGAEVPQSSWDMSQERAFMENLFCQRFNFLLILFTVVLAGAASATTQTKQTAVLGVGCVFCGLISLTVYRNYVKLMAILKLLHGMSGHPVAIIGMSVKQKGLRGLFGVNPIIGILIPFLCTSTLILGTLLSWIGFLKATGSGN
jgi:hypothetical protein